MRIPIVKKNQYHKGELLLNLAGWVCIVMEATRGNNPTIIPMVEVFGIHHECGSCYVTDILRRIGLEEFNLYKKQLGFADEDLYFKGQLIAHPENLI